MKFVGKYLYDGIYFTDCQITIKKKEILNITFNPRPIFTHYVEPKNAKKFKFKKYLSDKPLTPVGHNYYLKYVGKNGVEQTISLKLNPIKFVWIKFITQKIKFNWYNILTLTLAAIFGITSTYFQIQNNDLRDKENNNLKLMDSIAAEIAKIKLNNKLLMNSDLKINKEVIELKLKIESIKQLEEK